MLVEVDVLVVVLVLVELDVKRKPNQLSPEYLNHPFWLVLQNSSPETGSAGDALSTLSLPVILVTCVSAIVPLYH